MPEVARSSISIQQMSEQHLAQALGLCRASGWNQIRQDWQRLICYEPNGCFTAICDGQVAGTVTTTRYGRQLGWIGMMLVHPDFRRLGIATALVQHSISYLNDHHVRCVKLDATPLGQTVYEKLDFTVEWSFHRWSRQPSTAATQPQRSKESSLVSAAAIDLDRDAFGANRGDFLQLLRGESFVHVARDGYGMLRPGYLASYLGPVAARTRSAAETIIAELCERTDRTIFWDVPTPNADAIQLAKAFGFRAVRDLTRMRLGDDCSRPNIQLQFALADPGTG